MASFTRKVPTASGAQAVQIVHKNGRQVVGVDYIGSAQDDAELAALLEFARQHLHAGQQALDLGAWWRALARTGAHAPRRLSARW